MNYQIYILIFIFMDIDNTCLCKHEQTQQQHKVVSMIQKRHDNTKCQPQHVWLQEEGN